MTQNQQTIQCEELTDRGETVEDTLRHNDKDQKAIWSVLLLGMGKNVDSSSLTEVPTDRIILGSDRKWADSR